MTTNNTQIWIQTSAPSENWSSIASDSTGQYLAAVVNGGGIYTSSNYGQTWAQTSANSNLEWRCIASDSTGQYLAVVVYNGGIYTSSNYGSTWTQTDASSSTYTSITSDSTGQYLAASCYGGYIYTGVYSNSTWTWTKQTGAPNTYWTSITSDSTGQYLAATQTGGGFIYTGVYSNSSWTWTQQTSSGTEDWQSIASNSTGQNLAAVVYGGGIYTSNDYGSTWTQTSAPSNLNWWDITSDSTGQYLTVVVQFGGIYTSSNYGSTWTQTNAPSVDWYSITSNSTGTALAATSNTNGYIYSYINNNSGFLTNFSSSISSFTDILSAVSISTNLSGNTDTTINGPYYGRYFYLGDLLIQFSDFSSGEPAANGYTYYSIAFPIEFAATPYLVMATPAIGSNNTDQYWNNFTVVTSYTSSYINLTFNAKDSAPITCSFLAIGPANTNSSTSTTVSTFNSNFLSNFNGSSYTSSFDILSTVSTPASSVSGWPSTYNARYFYLGDLIIQFSDFSDPFTANASVASYTIDFPVPFAGSPYVVIVSPSGGNPSPNYNNYVTLTGYTDSNFTVDILNLPVAVSFLAIGPRYTNSSTSTTVSTFNSNFLSNFTNSISSIDILSTVSTPATSVSGWPSTYNARYFYLGDLLIQFSDFSEGFAANEFANSKGQAYSVDFPIAFSSNPYVILVSPTVGNSNNYVFTTLTAYSATGFGIYIGNNTGTFSYLAIGPR
jgi:hypothetical protein